MKSMLANIMSASHLGLFCLSVSHKKDARLILFNKEGFHADNITSYTS